MKRENLSIRHKAASHAVLPCQEKRGGLTGQGLRGLKKTCLIERPKTGSCFASAEQGRVVGRSTNGLGCSASMPTLSSHKGGALIGFFLDPQRAYDSHPNVGQRSDGHTVTLALLALA